MQRDPVQLGAGHHQSAGGQSIFKEHVATGYIGLFRDPFGDPAQWIPSVCHRHALCPFRPADDPQHHPSPRGANILCALSHSFVFTAVVVATGRRKRAEIRGQRSEGRRPPIGLRPGGGRPICTCFPALLSKNPLWLIHGRVERMCFQLCPPRSTE